MEQAKKHLKVSSYIVLLFVVLTLIELIAAIFLGDLSSAQAPGNLVLITQIFLLVFSALLMLPKIYVGIKGLRIAKNPVPCKKHIVWAVIILVFTALELIEPISAMIRQGDFSGNARVFFSIMLEVVIYWDYIVYARSLNKELAKTEEQA